MHIIEVFGRLFISALFLIEAVKKFLNPDESIMYMDGFGVPEFLFYPALLVELILPLLLIVGYKIRISALALAVFTIIVTLIFHTDFSNNMQMIAFLKNFAITGGLMVLFSQKPQICTLDYYLESKKGN